MINDAIKLAIEKGGWNPGGIKGLVTADCNVASFIKKKEAVLNPLFWRALATARLYKASDFDSKQPTWLYHAHQYFDLVLTGGDVEKFWSDLLNLKQ